MKNACVIGWPISHSRSPLIHNYWLRRYRLAGTYSRVPVKAKNLERFITDLPESQYLGCNVTIPHKEQACLLVTPADENVRRLGAVNTIYRREDKLFGASTDGEGFIANLPGLNLKNKRAVVLGAGGAAKSIIGALADRGMTEIAVINRTLERAKQLRAIFGPVVVPSAWEKRNETLAECVLLVNATALGMSGQPPLDIDLSRLPPTSFVTDIVYNPLKTPLLLDAARHGHPVAGGLGMLLHQAVGGFELWFGKRPEVTDELYDLVARDIDPDYAP
ncbi:MAG: shikimate dehydrogenase [Aestuariivirga sp.]